MILQILVTIDLFITLSTVLAINVGKNLIRYSYLDHVFLIQTKKDTKRMGIRVVLRSNVMKTVAR